VKERSGNILEAIGMGKHFLRRKKSSSSTAKRNDVQMGYMKWSLN
jgi:hypothetical protein